MTSIPFYQSHGFGSRKNIELAAGAAEGVFCPLGAVNVAELLTPYDTQYNVAMSYMKDYNFNYSPDDHNGLTKEAFNMVVVKDGDWALVD
jgi:branched-chain amino acid transport system substrate-binding protein